MIRAVEAHSKTPGGQEIFRFGIVVAQQLQAWCACFETAASRAKASSRRTHAADPALRGFFRSLSASCGDLLTRSFAPVTERDTNYLNPLQFNKIEQIHQAM